MTKPRTRPVTSAPAIPRQRAAEPELPPVVEAPAVEAPAESTPRLPAAQYPWPEPWRSARGARPRTEFWDVATASWRASAPTTRRRSED